MLRRDFIYLSGYTAALLTIPMASGCKPGQVDTEAQPFLFSHLADVKTIIETGQAYRRDHPGEDDKNKLSALLLANSKFKRTADSEAIRDMLISKVRDDFKNGNMAVILGWVLSVTEARQCALFSITQSQ